MMTICQGLMCSPVRTGRTGWGFGVLLVCIAMGGASAGAQVAGACPNEALRQELRSGQLPNCRAYELVTPSYKTGAKMEEQQVGALQGAISEDGSRVIDFALGSFAGTKSEPFADTAYEFSRTDAGWIASALDPPGSLSPESIYDAASKDLTRTLWGLHAASQSLYEDDFWVREPDGRFVEVGPMAPPLHGGGPPSGTTNEFNRISFIRTAYGLIGGASADLSHILVGVDGQLGGLGNMWPGDGTLGGSELNSLYEYVGTGLARPELVGVNNEGKQISQCGTDLGASKLGGSGSAREGDKYNAVSASGETVFFTARKGGCTGLNENRETKIGEGPTVNELYARIDSKETVRISEPLPFQCRKCQTAHTTVKTVEAPAEFAGASNDGSKAFFTTEQELLGGHKTNNLYEYDFDNEPETKIVLVSAGSAAPEVQGVARVSEDGSHVYFVAKGLLTGEPRGGGCASELTAAELKEEEEEATKELEEKGSALKARRCRPNLGKDNLYVFERDAAYANGQVRFVATLSAGDAGDWSTTDSRPVDATSDGRFLVFTSSTDLTAGDTSTASQVFEYDAQEEQLVRASIGQNGFNNNGNTSVYAARIPEPIFNHVDNPTEVESHVSVSDDGSYVFFQSVDDLTEAAEVAKAAGAASVYEYHSEGSIAGGNVYLISDGKDATPRTAGASMGSGLLGASASGSDVLFETGDPLLSSDTNTNFDFYDARVGGGFPEPAVQAACEGEECQGPLSRPSLLVTPGSTSTAGGGNLVPPPESKPPAPAVPRPVVKSLTRAQKLARALKACGKAPKRERGSCRARARKRYGGKAAAKKSSGGGR